MIQTFFNFIYNMVKHLNIPSMAILSFSFATHEEAYIFFIYNVTFAAKTKFKRKYVCLLRRFRHNNLLTTTGIFM